MASTVVLALGLIVLLQATAQGNAFTTETLRRTEVANTPSLVPELSVYDADGNQSTLRQLLADGDKVWIVDFVYTRCQTICTTLGTVFQQLQHQIQLRRLDDKLGLLSVSFDPAHDTPDALGIYRDRMRMDPAIWRIVTLSSPLDRRQLLDAFGIIVITAPLGEFEHNAALHLVGGAGRLFRIVDYDDATVALDIALATAP
ncbi:MAG: SCO family protein [Limnohabitans sp.]|nr:SCO family protein [Limnohabitans sp.]